MLAWGKICLWGTTLRVPQPALIVGTLQAKASRAPHCQPGAYRSCCGEGRSWQCPWVPWGIIWVNIPGWRKCTAWEQAGSWAQFLWVERGPLNCAWRMPGWDRKNFLFLPLKYFSIFLLDLKTGCTHFTRLCCKGFSNTHVSLRGSAESGLRAVMWSSSATYRQHRSLRFSDAPTPPVDHWGTGTNSGSLKLFKARLLHSN